MTNKPDWDYKIEFSHRYPPLVRLFKIQLCSREATSERVLATEFISIFDISNYLPYKDKMGQFLPTYGPRFIDLYDQPENSRVRKTPENFSDDEFSFDEDLNLSLSKEKSNSPTYSPVSGNGSFFVARLLLKIESKKAISSKETEASEKNGSSGVQNKAKTEEVVKSKEEIRDFVAFAIISEVSMIDQRFSAGEISFQLCVGKIVIFNIKYPFKRFLQKRTKSTF